MRAVASGVAELRSGLGLDPDAAGVALLGGPKAAGFPASFDHPGAAAFDVQRFRDPGLPSATPGGDLVYVTLGSEAHSMPFFGQVLREAVTGALSAGLRVVVSTGTDLDAEVLGGLEGDLQVERWVDQAEVLHEACVMVCHGGSGSTLGALAAAVPLVVVPLFADQPDNAERVEATETGRRVNPGPQLAERIGAAVQQLVKEPPPGSARLAAEIAALPPADAAVAWLESLSRRPGG
jgi:UDP:flavonoid glycosyltransferase YjiC (YdhE family)